MAEKLKTEGNALHKKGDHSAAIELYTLASRCNIRCSQYCLTVDSYDGTLYLDHCCGRLEPTNPVYHSNKSACFQVSYGLVLGYYSLIDSLSDVS